MKLTVLGSGSTVPHPTRTSSAYWLETSGGSILLDCSATAPMRMAQEGVNWPNLDSIWISHFHMDHCGGLGPLLAGTKHAPRIKGRTKPLRIFGPAGIKRLVDNFSGVNNYRLLDQPFMVDVVEVEPLKKFEIVPGISATAISTPHTAESHAIRIEDRNQVLVYSADTGFFERIGSFADGADLLVLECSYFKGKRAKKHLELSEAIELIRKARPKGAMLTHFYEEWDKVDFVAEVAKFTPPCEVIEAVDGLRVEMG
jgi:ribonuclease BN (tRNA processing enzyme)